MEAYIADKKEFEKWDEFNSQCSNGNIFQGIGFNRAMNPQLLIVKENEEIVGGTIFFTPLKGIASYFSELRVVSGPVLKDVNNKALFELIICKLVEEAKKRHCISIALRMPFAGFEGSLLRQGFKVHDHKVPDHSFNVNLNPDKETLWQNLDKKTRNQIRKAKNEGVIVRQANEDELNTVYQLYLTRAKENKGQIPYPLTYFEGLKNHLKENVKFLVAEYHGKLIAESVFLLFKDKIYYFNNGSLSEHWNLNANQLLLWHMMETFAGSGKTLNLYGVPDGKDESAQGYNLYKFKAGFGGELVREFQYSSKVISPSRKLFFDKTFPIMLPLYKRLK